MEHPTDVLVIGRSCLDHFAVIDRYPAEDQKVPLEERIMEGGGQGGTSSCCIAKLGGRIDYVGCLGDDTAGEFCRRRLEAFGVSTEFVRRVEGGKTPEAFIFVTRASGKRTIIYERSNLPKIDIKDILPALSRNPKVLLLDPEVTYLSESLKTRIGNTAKIIYDCERWRTGLKAMMAAADYFIPSSDFLDTDRLALGHRPFAEKMSALEPSIPGTLVVTRGAQGAYYFDNSGLFRVAAPNVAVKDTTGAGDNFHAAFALAVARGYDLHAAVRLAVAVASLSCREYGGREGIPQMDEAAALAATLQTRKLYCE